MKLTATVKLLPTTEQRHLLRETLARANAACNSISTVAWDQQTFGQYKLHHAVYLDLKATSGLSSQVIVRCIAKVANSYKRNRRTRHSFRPTGAIAYDDRILRWMPNGVSIWTTGGRQTIEFICGDRARALLASRQGESKLFVRDGQWFLAFAANVEELSVNTPDDWLGVDLGVTNIAVDCDGTVYSGATVKAIRHRHRRLRAKLQAKGTHGARRRLKRRGRKEHRFAKHLNHVISKQLVATAERTKRGIALEDLTHIRARVRVSRPQRATLHSWAFGQLRAFVAYKAVLAGVPVVLVDPRNTSRTCPVCGCIDKANRPRQSEFSCTSCGFAGLADAVAATVIGRRAVVNRPYVSEGDHGVAPPRDKLPDVSGSR